MFFEVTAKDGKSLINAEHISQIEPHETGCYLYLVGYDTGIKVKEPYDFFEHYLKPTDIQTYYRNHIGLDTDEIVSNLRQLGIISANGFYLVEDGIIYG